MGQVVRLPFVPAGGGTRDELHSVSPVDGSLVGSYRVTAPGEVPLLLRRLRKQQERWRETPVRERVAKLRALRVRMADRAPDLAGILGREAGRPVVESYGAEILPTLNALEWLERNAGRVLAPERLKRWPPRVQEWEPYGVVGLLSPYNYPLFLSVPAIGAALAAGNAVLWKPSELAPGVSKLIHDLLQECGLGQCVQMVVGGPEQGEAVVEAGCDKYVLVGGVETGRRVLSRLGRLLKPAVAELSGVDPMVVCADANLELAADAAVWARIVGAGQTCMGPKRILVERPAYEHFTQLVLQRVRSLRVGEPLDPSTEVGPLRTEKAREHAQHLVQDAVSRGARLLWGGDVPDLGGCYLTPTLLTDCTDAMRLFQEDLLAPVLALSPVDDTEEAVERARGCAFALTASVWTRDRRRGERLARRLPGGVVSINDVILGAADGGTPFGGGGDSGYGRTRGAAGLREMVRPRVLDTGPPERLPRRHYFPYRAGTLEILKGLTALKGAGSRANALQMLARAVARYGRE